MSDYAAFLHQKSQLGHGDGFAPIEIPEFLFPFQRHATDWAIRTGRSGLYAACGLGKTPMQLTYADNVARHTGKPAIIATPLAVAYQTEREARKFGFDAKVSRDGTVHSPITITNVERLHYFNPDDFGGGAYDECFPPDTPVSVVCLDNSLMSVSIKDVQRGDRILNASGVDHVLAHYKRRINGAVRITAGANGFTCSENHLCFTLHGWRRAKDLQPGDFMVETGTAMRLVRGDIPSEIPSTRDAAFLRSILLSEMANEYTGVQGKGPQAGSAAKDQCVARRTIQSFNRRRAENPEREVSQVQQICRSGSEAEYLDRAQGNRAFAKGAGRQWMRDDLAATIALGDASRLGAGIRSNTGEATRRLSDVLQARSGRSDPEDRDRTRWPQAPQSYTERKGLKEGRQAGFVRVDRVEILELGHPDLDQYRDEDGHVYFHDLEAERHPSFSVNGLLVHNSSGIKAFCGKRRKQITRFFSKMPYRLLCSGTPSPNDFIELGTQSECLGVMTQSEMLGYFFRETQYMRHTVFREGDFWNQTKWHFKPHSEQPFWRWVASWARAFRLPSDLGYSDEGFILPPISHEQHIVDVPYIPPGELFPRPAITLREQKEEAKYTIKERCEKVAELVADGKPAIAWCALNEEGEYLAKIIPDAVEVAGRHSDDYKEKALNDFAMGNFRVLITKPKIACWGMNYQHCSHMTFFPTHSYEQFHQGISRCHRFGQHDPVKIDIVSSPGEAHVIEGLTTKIMQADQMFTALCKYMHDSEAMYETDKHLKTLEVPEWLGSPNEVPVEEELVTCQ